MGEAKRKSASGLVAVMESDDFQFRGAFIARIAGYGVPPEAQRQVTDLFYEYIAFARSFGEALGPEHDTRSRAAFHEAGHAVVAAAFGFIPTKVYVAQNNRGSWIGRTLYDEKRAPPRETSPWTSPEDDWRLAANIIAGFAAEATMVGLRASSSIDEQLVFNVMTGALTTKLELSTKLNAAFIDGMREVWGLLKQHRKPLQAIGDALMGETTLERDRLDPLLAGIFEPGRDRAAAFVSKLRAGPSRGVQALAALATFQRGAARGAPTAAS